MSKVTTEKYEKGDHCEYAQKTPVGLEIGHFNPKLGQKPWKPCSQNSPKGHSH